MEPNLFLLLAEKYVAGTATEDERAIVEAYWELLSEGGAGSLDAAALERIGGQIKTNVFARIQAGRAKVRRLRPKWVRYAAAAVFAAAIATSYLLVLVNRGKERPVGSLSAKVDVRAPDRNRAAITLGTDSTVYLDKIATGQTITVNGIQLTKLQDGKVVFTGTADGPMVNSTASNPRNSRVMDLELDDHSHVWLNAGSSITFPRAFTGDKREVSIDGEAYFEVAHDAKRPFIVSRGDTRVEVLGTHFNVKAYDNEPDLRITLLQGKVKVHTKEKEQLLAPGEQAVVDKNAIQLATSVDLEDVMAWKRGFTSFHGADMGEIMRELERWYDITTEIKGTISTRRMIDVPRSALLQDVLKSLLDDNGVRYEYDAQKKKLTLLP